MTDVASEDVERALSGVMMAAAFVMEPEVWPGFTAYVERTTGSDFTATPRTMDFALIVDALRAGIAQRAGRDPKTPYPPAYPHPGSAP